ncbi:MAG: hypothetical protein GY854_26910 [Deltaproteobacteria bacterium]|nr:hypothetical protein [Deltaproteobacteria bacterium]
MSLCLSTEQMRAETRRDIGVPVDDNGLIFAYTCGNVWEQTRDRWKICPKGGTSSRVVDPEGPSRTGPVDQVLRGGGFLLVRSK